MFELTGFQRDLLYCIAAVEEPSGLGLKDELEEQSSTEINHKLLSPNLQTLVDEGYLKKRTLDHRANAYEVTDSGRELLVERQEWEVAQLLGTGLILLIQ